LSQFQVKVAQAVSAEAGIVEEARQDFDPVVLGATQESATDRDNQAWQEVQIEGQNGWVTAQFLQPIP
jgi:uncharacterized protein YgiM (DUF1202 family)